MSTTHTPRPTKKQQRQRKRLRYPDIKPFEAVVIARPECGVNKPMWTKQARKVLRGAFIFSRYPGLTPRQMRSKYTPHVGKKQLAKQAA